MSAKQGNLIEIYKIFLINDCHINIYLSLIKQLFVVTHTILQTDCYMCVDYKNNFRQMFVSTKKNCLFLNFHKNVTRFKCWSTDD